MMQVLFFLVDRLLICYTEVEARLVARGINIDFYESENRSADNGI